MHCPDPELVWLGRVQGEEWEKGSVLLPAPRMLYGFFWKKCKRERGPGIQNLRSRVATLKKSVGLDLGSKRVTFAV